MKRIIFSFLLICFIWHNSMLNSFAVSTISMDDTAFYAINNDLDLITWTFDNQNSQKKMLENVSGVSGNYAIKSDGTLWTWGDSLFGHFEDPTKVMSNVKDIEVSDRFAFIIKYDNSLWGIGSNMCHSMGLTDYRLVTNQPVKVMNNVSKAIPGRTHGVILKTDGSIVTTGANIWGVLGIGEDREIGTPRSVPEINDVTDIYAGQYSVYAFKGDALWMWGTTFEFDETYAIFCQNTPKEYMKDVQQISSKDGYNFLLMKDGSLWISGIDKSEKSGYTNAEDGPIILKMPYYLADDIYCINNGWNNLNRALILKNDGQLYELNLSKDESNIVVPQIRNCTIDDVKLPVHRDQIARKQYNDISTSLHAHEIEKLINADIINGVTDTKFMPDKKINRAETAALMLRMTGKDNESGNVTFADVSKDSWYYNIAGASQKYNIFDGYEDNTFRGEDTVSELQFAVLAARTLRNEGTALDIEFKSAPDLSNIPDWAKTDIEYAYQYGIVTEDELKTLSDKGMTRGDAAVILYRLYQVI